MTTLHTAGGIELLIWVAFIIISMIAQASKAAKKHKQGRPDQEPSRAPTPHLDPQQELEEFLESLSRGGSRSEPAPPITEPERPVSPAPVAPRREPSSAPKPTPPTLPPVRIPGPAPVSKKAMPIAPPVVALTPAAHRKTVMDKNYITVDPEDLEAEYYSKLRVEIQTDLRDRHKLRKAVLLQEILNPPIALRKQEQ